MDSENSIELDAERQRAAELEEAAIQASLDGIDQTAYERYAECLSIYRAIDDRRGVLKTLLRLFYLAGWADFGDGLGMFSRRNGIIQDAYALARELGDKSLLASTLLALSTCSVKQSADVLDEALQLAREVGDRRVEAGVLARMAPRASTRKEPHRNIEVFKQALEIYREVDARGGQAQVYFSMAIHSSGADRIEYLERNIELLREIGDRKGLYHGLSLLWGTLPDDEADRIEALVLEALELARLADNETRMAGCYKALSRVARIRGDEALAVEHNAEANRMNPLYLEWEAEGTGE